VVAGAITPKTGLVFMSGFDAIMDNSSGGGYERKQFEAEQIIGLF
jgi:hypothetical protein